MKIKNFLIIFSLFIILMCCISTINAVSDDNLDVCVSEIDSSIDSISANDNEQLGSVDQSCSLPPTLSKINQNSDEIGDGDNSVLGISEDANILSASGDNSSQKSENKSSVGTFTDLKKLIDSSKVKLTLTKDYVFDPKVDKELVHGIQISKSIEINGNGHTVNGKNKATIFDIYADDVTISKIKLINGYNEFFGGAISWIGKNGHVEKSIFMNNNARIGGAIFVRHGNIVIDKNRFENNNAVSRGGAIMVVGFHTSITNNVFKNNHAKNKDDTSDRAVFYKSWSMIDKYDNNTFINNTKNIVAKGGSSAPSYQSYDSYSTNYDDEEQSQTFDNSEYSKIIVDNNEISINNNQITLDILNKIFNFDFTNCFILVYIDGKLVFNGTTTDDLSQLIFDLFKMLSGQHELKVESTGKDGKSNTYEENITFAE